MPATIPTLPAANGEAGLPVCRLDRPTAQDHRRPVVPCHRQKGNQVPSWRSNRTPGRRFFLYLARRSAIAYIFEIAANCAADLWEDGRLSKLLPCAPRFGVE